MASSDSSSPPLYLADLLAQLEQNTQEIARAMKPLNEKARHIEAEIRRVIQCNMAAVTGINPGDTIRHVGRGDLGNVIDFHESRQWGSEPPSVPVDPERIYIRVALLKKNGTPGKRWDAFRFIAEDGKPGVELVARAG